MALSARNALFLLLALAAAACVGCAKPSFEPAAKHAMTDAKDARPEVFFPEVSPL